MMIKKFHTLRRISGAFLLLLLVGIPFLRIGGESALRFDVPSLRLLFFGTGIGMADFFIVLIALIFLTFLILFATTVFGRIWCGWLCPQTVLCDATDFAQANLPRSPVARAAGSLAVLGMSAIVAGSAVGYFVSPYDLSNVLHAGGKAARIVVGSWSALTAIFFLDLIALRRRFCATVCPYAKAQSVFFDDRTLTVAFDETRAAECMRCDACLKACPVGIDIRRGAQLACIHCADCVDACAQRMAARSRPSLIGYVWGSFAAPARGIRINPVITGVIAALSLLFLLFLSFSRMPFDMNIRLDYTATRSEQSLHGDANVYELSLSNLTGADLVLDLTGRSEAGPIRVDPASVTLAKGAAVVRIPLTVTVIAPPAGQRIKVTLLARSRAGGRGLSKDIFFIFQKKQ